MRKNIRWVLLLSLALAACSSDPEVEPEDETSCGPHGEAHDDHCHCDEGYVEVGGTCVADEDEDEELDCGPNGEAHGDHCHCDDGYVEVGGTCEPLTVLTSAVGINNHGDIVGRGTHLGVTRAYVLIRVN